MEPALGFFEKKTRIVPLWSFCKQQSKTTKVWPNEPAGGRAIVFFPFYVIIITSTLRFRLRYVTVTVLVAGAAFSFTLRYRSGREAHRGSR
jgi:hypothetical protein